MDPNEEITESNREIIQVASSSNEADWKNKQRHMTALRRRRRRRRQRYMEDLSCEVDRLRSENRHLFLLLNHRLESHRRVVEENAKLREEASQFRLMATRDPLQQIIITIIIKNLITFFFLPRPPMKPQRRGGMANDEEEY